MQCHSVRDTPRGDTLTVAGPFASEYDLKRRVASVRKNELTLLAKAGAFNWTGEKHDRRTALWRAERAGQDVGPLFANIPDEFEIDLNAPLLCMKINERLEADFFITGFTLGPHPMAVQRAELDSLGVMRAADQVSSRWDIRSDCVFGAAGPPGRFCGGWDGGF
jgi:error-prone DNA polymerase